MIVLQRATGKARIAGERIWLNPEHVSGVEGNWYSEQLREYCTNVTLSNGHTYPVVQECDDVVEMIEQAMS